ncbi:MAG: hypothetical protein NC114_06690 [Ruminococcus flavefaciens]|nr:hypothetical protein [Ruminococcus flavefaciens]
MKYTIHEEAQEVHAIMFDGTSEGVQEIARFLTVHDQACALATEMKLKDVDKVCCQIGYIRIANPRYFYLLEDDYLVLIKGSDPLVMNKDEFERLYQKTY